LEYLDSEYLTSSEFSKIVVEEAEGFKVTGRTTIHELLDGGIAEEKFEEDTVLRYPIISQFL